MLDAGTGVYRAREYLETSHLDIFLTHAHLDHVIGLTYLFDVVHVRPIERLRVFALAEKLAAIEKHLFAPPLFPIKPPWPLLPLDGEVMLTAPGGCGISPWSTGVGRSVSGSTGRAARWPT